MMEMMAGSEKGESGSSDPFSQAATITQRDSNGHICPLDERGRKKRHWTRIHEDREKNVLNVLHSHRQALHCFPVPGGTGRRDGERHSSKCLIGRRIGLKLLLLSYRTSNCFKCVGERGSRTGEGKRDRNLMPD